MTGTDGFTGERMSTDIAGYPPVMYDLFRVQAEQFARGAFGDQFADEVVAFRQSVADKTAGDQ